MTSQYLLSDLQSNPYVQAALTPVTLTLQQLAPTFTKPIGPANGGTGFADYARGDVLVGGLGGALAKLPIGAPGQILACGNGVVTWSGDLISLQRSMTSSNVVGLYTNTDSQLQALAQQFASEGITVGELGQQMSYITGQITAVANQVNSNALALAAQNASIASVTASMQLANSDVATLAGDVAAMNASIASVSGDLAAQASETAGVQSAVATLNGSIASAEAGVSNNSMFKNLLVNGDFSVWQRGTYFSAANNPKYVTADHWLHGQFSGGTLTSQQGSSAVGGLTVSTLKLSLVGNSGGFQLQNAVEDASLLQGQTATASVWVRDTAVTSFSLNVYQYSGATATVCSAQFQSSTVWTRATASFLVPALAAPVSSANGGYLLFSIEVPAGADFSGLEFALAQLEAGGAATPFGFRLRELEYALCRRYYETGYAAFSGHASASLGVARGFSYLVDKYAVPTLTFQVNSITGFQSAATVGFLNQPNAGSVRVVKDTTTGFGAYVVGFAAEAEVV